MKLGLYIAPFFLLLFSIYGQYLPDVVLLKFEDNYREEEKNAIFKAIQATPTYQFSIVPNLYTAQLPKNSDVTAIISILQHTRGIEYAEPDYIRTIEKTPNDIYYVDKQLWHLTKIQAENAWEIRTNSEVVIAILDTGIDYTHEDLKDNVWQNLQELNGLPGWDDDRNGYIDDVWGWNGLEKSPASFDDHEHGTHCAGIIGATGNNNTGVVGICWNIKMVAVKFLNKFGSGSVAGQLRGMEYIVQTPAKVVNMSFGGTDYSQAEYDGMKKLYEQGILCICAAGNEKQDNDIVPSYPCNYKLANIISVAASNYDDNLAEIFSNYGKKTVHLLAPGYHIWSTVPEFFNEWKYDWHHGTSMAAPHVTGTAALVWSQNPTYNFNNVRSRILESVDIIPNAPVITQGRLNLYRAVRGPEASAESNDLGCSGTTASTPFFPQGLVNFFMLALFIMFWKILPIRRTSTFL